jgi:hypothetical protein
MNKIFFIWLSLLIFLGFFSSAVLAEGAIWVNWGYIFEELLTNRYYSHGCFHLTPLGTKIFYEAVPRGTKVVVKSYSEWPSSWISQGLPDLLLCINSKETLKQAKEAFAKKENLLIEAYPRGGLFVFYYQGSPYAKLRFRPGFEKKGQMYFGQQDGQPVYDDFLLTATQAGEFTTYYYTNYFFAPRYPITTAIPYGEKIFKGGTGYYFKKNNQTFPLPQEIAEDLNAPQENRTFCFFDETYDKKGQLLSAKWGSHDYGTLVIGLSPDNRTINQDLIYATGMVLNDHREILGNLIKIITSGDEELSSSVEATGVFKEEKIFFDFLNNPVSFDSSQLPKEIRQYLLAFKIYNRLTVSQKEKTFTPLDPAYQAAFKYLTFGKISLRPTDYEALGAAGAASRRNNHWIINQEKLQGIYYSLYELANHVESSSRRYQKLLEFWPIFMKFKESLSQSSSDLLSEETVKRIITNHLIK